MGDFKSKQHKTYIAIRDNSFIEFFLNPARVFQIKLPPYQEFTTKRFGQRRTLLLHYTHVIEIS